MEQVVIRGYVDRILFQNAENGYCVLVVSDEKTEETVVGIFHGIDEGEHVYIEGEYVEHASYGKQIKMTKYEIIAPDDTKSIERYLGSGAIKGVGEKMAHRIVLKFGEDTFRIIEENPIRLTEIKGISERIAQKIAEQVYEKREMRRAMLFLQEYGISDRLAVKIYERYGDGLYDLLKTNPYKLAEDIDGVGFKRADEIAQNIGIPANSEYRTRCGLMYALTQSISLGNTCMPKMKLIEEAIAFLGIEREEAEIQLANLLVEHKVIIDVDKEDSYVFSPSVYRAENYCVDCLDNLDVDFYYFQEDCLTSEEKMIREKIARIEKETGITLNEMQRKAVLSAIVHGVMILTGGPGTGKTTTINVILKYFEKEQMEIQLAAPTGRAAKRMTEACGMEAKTIHRLLEFSGSSEDGAGAGFERNSSYPLEADVIIIDEMSMVDIFLFRSLLDAIPKGTRLLMVGDMDQLPSVGPGSVLKDLIESKVYPTVSLTEIFRQAKESDIVMNAHRIHDGVVPQIDNSKSKDFFFLKRDQVDQIKNELIKLVLDILPRNFNTNPLEVQVLTPMRKGVMGVESLNVLLQDAINPPKKSKREYHYADIVFREGDKVMQTKNDYQLEWEIVGKYNLPLQSGIGVFNGDVGIISEINEYAAVMKIQFDDGRQVMYPFENLDDLELAYAITIHKSQGSEYPAVVIPLLGVPSLLTYRNLLYTGVTRAKNCVILMGNEGVLEDMIKGENKQKRYTRLKNRIMER